MLYNLAQFVIVKSLINSFSTDSLALELKSELVLTSLVTRPSHWPRLIQIFHFHFFEGYPNPNWICIQPC